MSGRARVLWVPNALTALRILLLPVLIALMAAVTTTPGSWGPARAAAVALVLFLGATDWLDGYLARRLGATSRWGSTADAIADRLALLVPLFYVAVRDPAPFPHVPLWIPLWLVTLDLLTGSAWLIARWRAGARRPLSHNMVGRVGVWLLFTLVLWVMAGLPRAGVLALGLLGLGLTTASSVLYVRGWLRS